MHLQSNSPGVVQSGYRIVILFIGLFITIAAAGDISNKSSTMMALQQPPPVTAIERALAFPPDYMRREPVVHRANVNIFHIGTAVQFTDQKIFQKKAEIKNYYHLQSSSELTPMVATESRIEHSSKKSNDVVINSSTKKSDKTRKFFLKRICR